MDRIEKINKSELEMTKLQFKYYDFKELESIGYSGLIIRFNKDRETTIYSDLHHYPEQEHIFNQKYGDYLRLIKHIFLTVEDKKCIVYRYNEKWVVNRELSSLYSILKNSQIRNNYAGGLKIDKNGRISEMFLESIIKYNSFLEFLFVDSKMIVTPTDHMDVFLHTNNDETIENKLRKMIESCFGDKFAIKDI